MTDELTVLRMLFYDVHIDIGATLNLLQSACVCVICGCRAVQINNAKTPLALVLLHVATVIREIFVGKIFSWGKSTMKIKRTKIFIR